MIDNLGEVIAWKYGVPFTRRGEEVVVEGIGPLDSKTLAADLAAWQARVREPEGPTLKAVIDAIRRHDAALAAKIDEEAAKPTTRERL